MHNRHVSYFLSLSHRISILWFIIIFDLFYFLHVKLGSYFSWFEHYLLQKHYSLLLNAYAVILLFWITIYFEYGQPDKSFLGNIVIRYVCVWQATSLAGPDIQYWAPNSRSRYAIPFDEIKVKYILPGSGLH